MRQIRVPREESAEATAKINAFIAGLGIELGDRINAGYPHLALGLVPTPS